MPSDVVKWPVRDVRISWSIPHLNNEALVWKGETWAGIDTEGVVWMGGLFDLAVNKPWYYCRRCDQRQGFEDNYCPNCGLKLDWENLERDPEVEADVQRQWNEKIAEARRS